MPNDVSAGHPAITSGHPTREGGCVPAHVSDTPQRSGVDDKVR